MSLILDALKRSQQERQDGQSVPGLATAHYPESSAGGASPWLRALPWLGLVLALALVAWLLPGRRVSSSLVLSNLRCGWRTLTQALAHLFYFLSADGQ